MVDARQLRNRMIHEYVRDPEVLAAALSAGHVRQVRMEPSIQYVNTNK